MTPLVNPGSLALDERLLRMTFLKTQRDAGNHDKGGERRRLVLEFLKGIPDSLGEVLHVLGT